MGDDRPRALLIGERFLGSSHLAKYLQQHGCHCQFATSYDGVRSLLRARHFDIVLSPMKLRDASLIPLIEWLDGSDVTLFYCFPVESGGWWLPALRRGERCFGSPALRPSEFASVLDNAVQKAQLNTPAAEDAARPVVGESAASVLSFVPQKSTPAEPARAPAAALAKRKAAS